MKHHRMLVLALLLNAQIGLGADLQAQLIQCRLQADPITRLSCYDSLTDTPVDKPPTHLTSHSLAWHEIDTLERARTPDMPLFMLSQNDMDHTLTLTRPALRGATLSIGCASDITHIRVRLDAPWSGKTVTTSVDGHAVKGGWFVRDSGTLLEFGRGLPAIEELKYWSSARELTLQGEGSIVRFDLKGLADALHPLRQQCRW